MQRAQETELMEVCDENIVSNILDTFCLRVTF
jgi:hypothetical protein